MDEQNWYDGTYLGDFGYFVFSGSQGFGIHDEAWPGWSDEIFDQLSTPESSFPNSNHRHLIANQEAQQQPHGVAFSLEVPTSSPSLDLRSSASEHSYSSPSSISTLADPPFSIPNTTIGTPYRQQATRTPPHDNRRSASEIPLQINQYDPYRSLQRTSRAHIMSSSQRGQRRSALLRDQVVPIAQPFLLLFRLTYGSNHESMSKEMVVEIFRVASLTLVQTKELDDAWTPEKVHSQGQRVK